jgi:hypothetical protein
LGLLIDFWVVFVLETTPNNSPKQNLELIVKLLDSRFTARQVAKRLNITETRLNNWLVPLKKLGIIQKVGYGTWKTSWQKWANFQGKELQINTPLGSRQGGGIKFGVVRGHAFQFVVPLPERVGLQEWVRRVNNRGEWVELPKNKVIGLFFKGNRVWLTEKSVVVWFKRSFWGSSAQEAHDFALSDFRDWVFGLERFLKVKLFQGERLRFKVCRNHFALVRNDLAKLYDRENRKLQVYSDSGLWLIIDNSFNLFELEAVAPKSALPDNKVVQDFFNGLRENPALISDFLALKQESRLNFEAISDISANLSALIRVLEGAVKK